MSYEIDVKKLREALKMTQAQLAAELGVDQSTVSLWEKAGKKPRPPAMKLLAMFAAGKQIRAPRRRSKEVAA